MFAEHLLHLIVKLCHVTILILQLDPDVDLKLVIFGEYCYHGNLKSPYVNSSSIKLCLNIPFSSGQISSKYFKSNDGRLLSIGMQYLKG
jgi:hypothetical protein